MRPSTKEALKTSLWIPVVVAILTLGLGIVISEVQTKVGWLALLSALGICLGIFFCAFYVLVRKVCPISVDVVEGITRRMNQYVEKGAVTWLLTDKQLVEHERKLSTPVPAKTYESAPCLARKPRRAERSTPAAQAFKCTMRRRYRPAGRSRRACCMTTVDGIGG